MTVLIVTGTDTGVGKTVATAALAASLMAAGRKPVVVKPVQTGLAPGEPGDLDEVRRLVGDLPTREFVRLPAPLAPAAAARLAGVALPPVEAHARVIAGMADEHRPVEPVAWVEPVETTARLVDPYPDGRVMIVEGAGGLLVPLDSEGGTIADLALALQAAGAEVRVVVVVRAGLGTLNHTALTAEALRSRGLSCDALVIGSWPRRPDLAMRQNLLDLPDAAGAPLLGRLPARASTLAPELFRAAASGWLPSDGLPR